MSRKFIKNIKINQSIEEIFQLADKSKRTDKKGRIYFQFNLSDRTGTIDGRIWFPTPEQEELFEQVVHGDFLLVNGTTKIFQEAIQLSVTQLTRIEPSRVREEDFIRPNSADVPTLLIQLREMLHTITQPDLACLAEAFLVDHEFMTQFCKASAGVKLHHAYPGGLLEHTTQMMKLATSVASLYPQLNHDLLLMGAFLHDVGKTRELSNGREVRYTDQGQILGHPLLGIEIVQEKMIETQKNGEGVFNQEIAMLLKHLILSHHGSYENQSAKLPMTLEAMALHLIDSLDSKLAEFAKYMLEDPNLGAAWTNYIPGIERKLYKGKS